jgi:hypothetical protein
MCACVAWGLVGGPSELQRTSGGHRIKCALRNRSHCVYYNNNNMVGRCVSVSCMPACLLPLWQQAGGGGGTARISTRPPLTAASQQDTPIHTHNTPCPAPNRAWRGAFEWWRCAPVVCPRHIISLCGRLSGCLKHCSKGSQMHTHTYTRTARVVWWWCESVQATRTKTMYREREREREQTEIDRSIDRCLSVCLSV